MHTKTKVKNILSGEVDGQIITEELAEFLKLYTSNKKDIVPLHKKYKGVSSSTISQVKSRGNPMTESSRRGISDLIEIAIKNAERSSQQAKEMTANLINRSVCVS
jgi:hypothetical protein